MHFLDASYITSVGRIELKITVADVMVVWLISRECVHTVSVYDQEDFLGM